MDKVIIKNEATGRYDLRRFKSLSDITNGTTELIADNDNEATLYRNWALTEMALYRKQIA